MQPSPLVFLTHTIDDKPYACWYRLLSTTEVEVLAIGLIQTVSCDGINPAFPALSRIELRPNVGSSKVSAGSHPRGAS